LSPPLVFARFYFCQLALRVAFSSMETRLFFRLKQAKWINNADFSTRDEVVNVRFRVERRQRARRRAFFRSNECQQNEK
jgi:hypothetical protein